MKTFLFLSVFCFFCEGQVVFAGSSPSVQLSREAATQLMGAGHKRELNCDILLKKTWPYPNAQVTPMCSEAETSCLRYGLLRQASAKDLSLARDDAQLKLQGCKLAIEATLASSQSLGEAAGYGPSY